MLKISRYVEIYSLADHDRNQHLRPTLFAPQHASLGDLSQGGEFGGSASARVISLDATDQPLNQMARPGATPEPGR
jgi:hypothetical protein